MKTLKKLHAKIRKWAQGGPRRQPTRRARPGLEVLEQRAVPTSTPIDLGVWTSLHGGALAISTVHDASGNLDVFAIGTNHSVYYQSQSPSGTWSGVWKPLGGPLSGTVSSISTALDANGNLDVFGIGSNQAVWYRSQTPYSAPPSLTGSPLGGIWGTWQPLGGAVTSLSTVRDANGNLDVFGIAPDHSVWHTSLSAYSRTWSVWKSLGGWVSSISTTLDAKGNLDVFGIGSNQAVWYTSQSPSNSPWGPWTSLGGQVTSLSTAVDASGNLDVFGIGTDQAAWVISQAPNRPWSLWGSLGGGLTSITAIRNNCWDMTLFGIAPDKTVWVDEEGTIGHWSGWMPLNGQGPAISAATDASGRMAVFAVGTDQAVWYSEQAAYTPVKGTLFGPSGVPSFLDVHQTNVGDCWLLASLAEVADRTPSVIMSMFTPDGTVVDNGSVVPQYLVRFYNSRGVAQYVTVDTELPAGLGDQPVGGPGAVNGSSSPVLWPALAEKAYAEANGAGIVTTNHVGFNDYAALNGGGSSWALQAITGIQANDFSSFNLGNVISQWEVGGLVTLGTSSPTSSFIVGGHCYALVNYVPSHGNSPFEVFNPWGDGVNGWAPGDTGTTYGLFWTNAAFLSQNFSGDSFGSAAAQGGQEGRDALSSQKATDFAFIADLLDPHSKIRSGSAAVLLPGLAGL